MPDFPYGTDYPDAEWIDRDGKPIDDDDIEADLAAAAAAEFEKRVACRTYDLHIERDARRRLDDQDHPPITAPPVKSLAELLAEPDTPISYRVGDVAPENARIIVSAQYKAGKTTLVGNLIRSLVDGDPFLGAFTVHTPARRIVLIDNEMSENTLRRWLRDQAITNTAAVADVLALRGKVAAFNLLDDRRRYQWATRLADLGCDYLILDCLRPCLDALGLDEGREAGQFLTAYDALLDEAAITNTAIVQHMGHTGERSRGDSRIQDWPDAIWRLVRETDEPGSPRYFTAYGRDVDIGEGRLAFDPITRQLTYSKGSRGDAKTEAAKLAVIEALAAAGEPLSTRGVESAVTGEHTQKAIRAGAAAAVHDGLVTVTAGPRRAKLHSIAYPCSECGMPVASRTQRHESCSSEMQGTVRMTPSASVR